MFSKELLVAALSRSDTLQGRTIEEFFATGSAPDPAERTLLVSGVLESCLTSRPEGQTRVETPHLDVRYRASQESQHARS